MIAANLESLEIQPLETYFLLSQIIILGIVIRLIRFRKKGMFTWDEAAYYREARLGLILYQFLSTNWRELISLKKRPDEERRKILLSQLTDGIYRPGSYVYYKPWHLLLNGISTKIIGHHDYAVAIPSFMVGILSIIVVYGIGSIAFGPVVGLIAAFLLALSGLHILHSRSSSPEIRTAFCYIVILLISAAQKTLVKDTSNSFEQLLSYPSLLMLATSAFFMCGILCFNHAWITFFPALYIFSEALYTVTSGSQTIEVFIASQLIYFSFMLLFFFITDIPYLFLNYYFKEAKVESNFKKIANVFGEWLVFLKYRTKPTTKEYTKAPKWYWLIFYPNTLYHSEGIIFSLAATAGAILMLIKHTPVSLYFAVQGICIMAALTFIPFKAARGLMPLIPVLCISAAYSVSAVPLIVFAPLFIIMTVRGLAYSIRVIKLTSGIKTAAGFIKEQGHTYFQCSSAP